MTHKPVLPFIKAMTQRYLRHRVGTQSAALAFYLLFSIFPFLIFLSSLLGLLSLNIEAILQGLAQLLPSEVVSIIESYLYYVGSNSSVQLLLLGLFFSFYFPMRATNVLMRGVRTAYRLGPPLSPVFHVAKTLLYTLLLLLTIALTLTLMTVGDRALTYAVTTFGLPVEIAQLWVGLRFPLLALVMYTAIHTLYAMSQNSRLPFRALAPGALTALLAWMCVSWLYAYYVDNLANYAQLYGSIATMIVFLIWLQISATVLLMGAEWNGALQGNHEQSP
ncbi:YihY/virulence factor BrkB family protein [Bengtsoniella intestinalis]|uniref:YihY/virulence factor BrkB family protein n=1 Tax=Bengtsoniella intestinalis TaxID=3073143 RepID=UPI00391F2B68